MTKITEKLFYGLLVTLMLSFVYGITSNAAVSVKSISSVNSLTKVKSITLAKGKKATLSTTVSVTPDKAANRAVTYKTSKKKVATVSKKGVITAKKAGKAKITVISKKNKKKKAIVNVKVVSGKVTKVSFGNLSKKIVTLGWNESTTINPIVGVKGSNYNKALLWTTSNAEIATVTAKGKVTAVAPGTAKITAKSTDGTNKTDYLMIKVDSTVISAGTADVVAEFKLDTSKIATDLDIIVKAAGIKDEKNTKVTLVINDRDTETTKSVEEAREYIKNLSNENKGMPKTVKITISNKQLNEYGPMVIAVPSIKEVNIDGVKITDIKASTFKIDGQEMKYTVNGKTLVIGGDQTSNASIIKLVNDNIIKAEKQ